MNLYHSNKPHLEFQRKFSGQLKLKNPSPPKKKKHEFIWYRSETSSLDREIYLFSTVKLWLPKNTLGSSGR